MVPIALVVALGLTMMVAFYASRHEQSVISQNQAALERLGASVVESLQAIMLTGNGDMAREVADHYKHVPHIDDFRILRLDGSEAFHDNQTIDAVNRRRGEEEFWPREQTQHIQVLPSDNPALARVRGNRRPDVDYQRDWENGGRMTVLYPIANEDDCHKCHGSDEALRGIVKITTSMAGVEADIAATRRLSILVLIGSLSAMLLTAGLVVRRSVIAPLVEVTAAMQRVSGGDLTHQVPVPGRDELSVMATSFNRMTAQLLQTYTGLQNEQDKLTTIILSAREGIVVTDHARNVVLVNPAAERLLGKSTAQIVEGGFLGLFDDPALLAGQIESGTGESAPINFRWRERFLSVRAASIRAQDGDEIGSAALIRDVTEERRREDQLVVLSTTDDLTGLYNRRFLDDALERELARAGRSGSRLSVLMFDVDFFKRFNDEHGHDQGDRVLQAIAASTRATLRGSDLACRYGGEEFLVILPETDAGEAALVAERLRGAVAETDVDGLTVTISVGVATWPSARIRDGDTLVSSADAALYAAKNAGRNQVMAA